MPLPKHEYTAEDYWALPDGTRAELIDGELWDLASPSRTHQRLALELAADLRDFIREHGGSCEVNAAPFAVNLFADDATFVEPDVTVVCDRDKLTDRGCNGAPDFVVEVVSPSSGGMDYVTKLSLYRDAGVREYWICDPARRRTMVYPFGMDVAVPTIYPFAEPVPSSVLTSFAMDFERVINGL
jgi:Uma2 family endonuclease